MLALLVLAALIHADSDVDWLIKKPSSHAAVKDACWVYGNVKQCGLEMSNGLITRRFIMSPTFGTIDYISNATTEKGGEQSMLRAIGSEGSVVIDGTTYYIGGLKQKSTFRAYCNRSELELASEMARFVYKGHRVLPPSAPFEWTPGTRHSPSEVSWPPKGVSLAVDFALQNQSTGWVQVGSFHGAPSVQDRQVFKLPTATKAQRWRWHCSSTFSEYQVNVMELTFRDSSGKWLDNSHFNLTNSPVVADSGSRPDGAAGGEAWRAMDGKNTTGWDSVADASEYWLEIDFGTPIIVDALGVLTLGDTTHDPKDFTLSALSVAPLPSKLARLNLTVHYELYDGIPLLSKWVTVSMGAGGPSTDDVVLNGVEVEHFHAMPRFGAYLTHGSFHPGADAEGASSGVAPNPLFHAKTDQAHGASCHWLDDFPNSADPLPGCSSCKDEGAVEPYLSCTYSIGPGAHVNPTESFVSFRVLELITDSAEIERHTLMRHRVTQLLAPHVMENPVFFHATDVSEAGFKTAIDQMAELGFEMLIYSFGSGFKLETHDPVYLAKIKNQIAYAKSKGIEVGGYDLICLDRGHGGYGGNVGDQWDAVDSKSGALKQDACFASGWYDKLHGLVAGFINETGLAMLETDGPYGGGDCASTKHAHHHGEEDSVYRQTQLQSQFYKEMRAINVYVNQPDDFFFQGGSRSGMGYDEQQYSLPRWRDITISRMGMYDDLYVHLPTQGWMFLPLSMYHAGGAAATFLGHPEEYEWGLAQYLGAGTAACYRGDVLYHTPEMKATIAKWVSFYKAHRGTLIQPVVHLRRPDGQGWDGWLHVNPFSMGQAGKEVGVAVIFYPPNDSQSLTLAIPVYHCGLDTQAFVRIDGDAGNTVPVRRDYTIVITVDVKPQSIHTVVISRP